MEHIKIRPQEGAQTNFLSSHADIAIYGGAAGGGKTFALLIEPLRHLANSLFRGVIFRRTSPQIRNVGGLWDESGKLYSALGIHGRESNLDWASSTGWQLKFSHLEQESDKYNWQGSQMSFLGFDELTHFEESQFFYLLSRLRSMSGIRGYVRATCNPDSESWVADFLSWWIDQDTGYPIKHRSGKIRWFCRVGDLLEWADSVNELKENFGDDVEPKSVTFICASIHDNKLLLKSDPSYLSNLKAMSLVEREKLLYGNWKIRPMKGLVFKREWFEIVETSPQTGVCIRFWDRAATLPTNGKDPDFTVGCKIRKCDRNIYWIEDMVRFRGTPATVEQKIVETAAKDGVGVWVGLSQDPGQAGIVDVSYLSRQLSGYKIKIVRETGSKVVRAQPISSQAESGNVKLVNGFWNKAFLNELENFPEAKHDDQVDSLSGGFSLFKELVISTLRVRFL